MSELLVNTIKKADGTGSLTVPAESGTVVTTASPSLGRRNLIINGAMQVAQRGTSSTADGYTTVDRWRPASNSTEEVVHTYSKSTDAPSGFSNSFKAIVDTAETTLDADDTWKFEQRFEGQDLQVIAKGTSDAKPLTVSFWVKSSTTGTYICELDDRDNTRAYSQAYTIDSADTWEYKTLTYTGDTTGSLDNDNGQSFRLGFMLAAGSDYTSGTLTTGWASRVDANRFVGQTNLAASVNNYWQITGVQLEVGSVATPFEHRSYGEELALCERYFQVLADYDNSNKGQFMALAHTTTTARAFIQLRHQMRAAPSIETNSSISNSWRWTGAGQNKYNDTIDFHSSSPTFFGLTNPDGTFSVGALHLFVNASGAYCYADAEL